jgi:hypothetical protein
MKKMKNAMLVVAGGLLMLTVATVSCSKSGGGTSTPPGAPTVTGATAGSVDTVGKSATITLTGTNLTGATITSSSSSVTITNVVVASGGTSLTGTITVASNATPGPVTLTLTTSGGSTSGTITIVPVGSTVTSNSVASANLLAHWTFDTDSKETGSSIAATTITGVTFGGSGQIGGCATFTAGYLLYPVIPQIDVDTALESYSISMWVNIPTASNNTGLLRSLFQINPTTYPDIWGALSLSLNNNGVGTDTLPLRADQVQIDGRGPTQATTSTNVAGATGKWVFITETYDGNNNNQTLKLYANGNMVDSTQFTDVLKTGTQSTFRIVPGGGPSFTGTPANYVSIGTLAFFDRGNNLGDGYGNSAPVASARPWAAGQITGQIDDIRLFNKPLSIAQVDSLYILGTAGK